MKLKVILLFIFMLFLSPLNIHGEHIYNKDDGYHYYFDDSSGFYIRLDSPRKNNISTNIIEDLTFTIYWYDKQNRQPIYGYDDIDYSYNGYFAVSTDVKHLKITKRAYEHTYTIHDIDTQLTQTKTGYKIPIEINNYDSSDTSFRNFLGESGKIDIELNYYHVDHTLAEYYVDFVDGKDMKLFGDKLMLRFPINTYIADNSVYQRVLIDQKLVVTVNEKPIPNDNYLFLSQQFSIMNADRRSLFPKPSAFGDITIKYEGNVPREMEAYNLAVLKLIDGKWVPIGGIVNSQQKSVTAVFDSFDTYALGLVYKDYGLVNHPARKEVLGLAYKGIIQPEIDKKDLSLLSNLDRPIDRFTFTVLLSRALGFQPVDYTGVFSDVEESSYSEDDLQYLMAGVMNGLIYGKESNLPGYMIMEPNKSITREEAIAFLARGISLNSGTDSKTSKFTKKRRGTTEEPEDPTSQLKTIYKDANKISDWAANAVFQVTNEKLITVKDGYFRPKASLTNGEAMVMIYNLMETKKLK